MSFIVPEMPGLDSQRWSFYIVLKSAHSSIVMTTQENILDNFATLFIVCFVHIL